MKLSCLMTVFNEASFVDYAIQSCLPYVDHLVIVEGSYLENIKLGVSERSTDGTLEIIEKYRNNEKVHIIFANEKSDPQQRNVGLKKIKELNPDGWMQIIDGDEIYKKEMFSVIRSIMRQLDKDKKYGVYFKSITFVNDFEHYCEQQFPRLFKITPECKFIDDNFMSWPDKQATWNLKSVLKIPYISYYHMSFCKGAARFKTKRDWWMSRGLGKDFDYGWKIDESGKITDENHEIHEYTGKLPEILKTHPLYPKEEEKKDE